MKMLSKEIQMVDELMIPVEHDNILMFYPLPWKVSTFPNPSAHNLFLYIFSLYTSLHNTLTHIILLR